MFVERIAKASSQGKEAHIIYRLEAIDKYNRKSFYILSVDKLKEAIFLHDVRNGALDVRDYGKLIRSGYGSLPTEL